MPSAYDNHWKRLAELLGPDEAAAERARVTADEQADRYWARIAKFKRELPKLQIWLAEAEQDSRDDYAKKLRKQITYREDVLRMHEEEADDATRP